MGLLNPEDEVGQGPRGQLPIPQTDTTPGGSGLSVLQSASRTSGFVGPAINYAWERANAPSFGARVPGYDGLNDMPQGYEEFANSYANARSPAESAFLTAHYRSLQENRRNIASAGVGGLAASLAVGNADPVNLAMMATPLGGATRIGQAVKLGLANAGAATLQEFADHYLVAPRTLDQSLTNIGSSTLIGGILGGAIRPQVPAKSLQRLAESLDRDPTRLGPVVDRLDATAPVEPKAQVRGVEGSPGEPPGENWKRSRDIDAYVYDGGKASIHPMEDPGGKPIFEARLSDGEPIGRFPTAQEAAKASEAIVDTVERAIEAAKPIEPTTELPQLGEEHINPNAESTAGAAAAQQETLAGNTLVGGVRHLAEGIFGKVAPGLRMLTSPSLATRLLSQQLAEGRELLAKNLAGVRSKEAVETVMRKVEGQWWQAVQQHDAHYSEYAARMRESGQPAMSATEFERAVASAMRNGDQSPTPEIAKAAQSWRSKVFDPWKQRAQAAGLLPENVKALGEDSYLTRKWDPQKIRADRAGWSDLLTRYFMSKGLDQVEARDLASKATMNVMGNERGHMDWRTLEGAVPEAGPLKERSLDIPAALAEPYLENNVKYLAHSYLRSMAPEVEFTERFGSRDLRDQFNEIHDDYGRLMQKAKGDTKLSNYLEKRHDDDIRTLAMMRDRIYGTFGKPADPSAWYVRAGRLLRSDNALRLLGAATLAHIPDIANTIMRYGAPQTFAGMAKLATSVQAIGLARSEAKRFGVALDMVMNTAQALGDYGSHSQFIEQRAMARITRGFTIATLETPFITMTQTLASALGSHELIAAAEKIAAGGTLSKYRMAKFASSGIDEDMFGRIAKMAAAHSQEANGLKFAHSDLWTDRAAADAFDSAIVKDAHAMTLSPGVGDTPALMSTEMGKLLLQFKSFSFAAARHVLMPAVQGVAAGDMRTMVGISALLSAGGMSYFAKQIAAGQPIETDPKRLALEVMDKSNLMGWTSELIFPGLWSMGFKDLSRWSDRDPVETLGGPSLGTIASLYSKRFLSRAMPDEDPDAEHKPFSRSDLHFWRRLMPGQNHWVFRRGVNALEDAMGDALDLPGKSNEERAQEQH